jgi:hypothetical protein
MPEELGTKDVLEQVGARLGTLEQDVRSLASKVDARFDRMHPGNPGFSCGREHSVRDDSSLARRSHLRQLADVDGIDLGENWELVSAHEPFLRDVHGHRDKVILSSTPLRTGPRRASRRFLVGRPVPPDVDLSCLS